ncbi:transposase [Streptomyces lavendulae]|uniref:transposase n=1 Tax=Streptomyces lavendulae TaxID=1914 RepID=UPI0037221B07
MGERLVLEIFTVLDEQAVTLPAAEAGVGVRTGARTPIEVGDGVGDGSAFPTTAHLAAHAGLVPATVSSGGRSADLGRTQGAQECPCALGMPMRAVARPCRAFQTLTTVTQRTHRAHAVTVRWGTETLRVVADAATRAGRGRQADVYTHVEMASATGWACPAGGRLPRYALRRHPARRVATMCLASAWS